MNHTKEKDKNTLKKYDIGKDDTRQVWQPYFHSGPYIETKTEFRNINNSTDKTKRLDRKQKSSQN